MKKIMTFPKLSFALLACVLPLAMYADDTPQMGGMASDSTSMTHQSQMGMASGMMTTNAPQMEMASNSMNMASQPQMGMSQGMMATNAPQMGMESNSMNMANPSSMGNMAPGSMTSTNQP